MNDHPSVLGLRNAQELLRDITVEEFRVVGVQALRDWRKRSPSSLMFDLPGEFARSVLPLLANKKGIPVHPNAYEPFLSSQAEPWMQGVIDLLAWMVASGLALPLHDAESSVGGYAFRYRLTSAGIRFLDADQEHPLLPGFVERVVKRCQGLPEEFAVHLADAQTCVEHGLGRPAVVLAGLAYEAAIDSAIERLESDGKLVVKKGSKAAQRIGAVKDIIPQLFADAEKRGRAMAAWDFADRLRERRNDASHPGAVPGFSDLSEVHEWLLSAGRNLPGLWSVRV